MNLGLVQAIVSAQWRALLHARAKPWGGRVWLAFALACVWYGIWLLGAVAALFFSADSDSGALLRRHLGVALFGITLYWQLAPVMTVNSGVALQLSRLLIYPIPVSHLFLLEIVLRITASPEMLLLSLGIGIGLTCNASLPTWAGVGVLALIGVNLLLSSGLRDLLGRLFARRGVREVLIIGLTLLSALPQLLVATGFPPQYRRLLEHVFLAEVWPWSAAANIGVGQSNGMAIVLLGGWLAVMWVFARWQFGRSLRFDAVEAGSNRGSNGRGLAVATWIGARLPDPLGGLVEKDLRVLSRSPRFRLLFLMGFSFGPLIWLPLVIGGEPDGFLHSNFLTVVSVYALMLAGEVLFWNSLGIDRSAAAVYFVAPVQFQWVLVAKNIVAAILMLLEFLVLTALCLLLRVPLRLAQFAEAFCVVAVFGMLLMSMGNLMSVRFARPIDPGKSWRGTQSGSTQFFLLLLYPLLSLPILLAFGARYAFESEIAFYGVIVFDAVLAACLYWVALESAANVQEERREALLASLTPASDLTET